jgi:hypothetical protein
MGSFTKLNLLFVVILSGFFMSFEKKDVGKSVATTSCSFLFSRHSPSAGLPPATNSQIQGEKLFPDQYDLRQEVKKGLDSHFKYKKKLKRVRQAVTGVKLPVKYIEWLTFNILSKSSYNKPHFLSHLHHFLFRLTPF